MRSESAPEKKKSLSGILLLTAALLLFLFIALSAALCLRFGRVRSVSSANLSGENIKSAPGVTARITSVSLYDRDHCRLVCSLLAEEGSGSYDAGLLLYEASTDRYHLLPTGYYEPDEVIDQFEKGATGLVSVFSMKEFSEPCPVFLRLSMDGETFLMDTGEILQPQYLREEYDRYHP